MFFVALIILGIISLVKLPVELYQGQSAGIVSVIVRARGGLPPLEVEKSITKPIEEAVATVSHMKSLYSHSREAESRVTMEFEPGTDMKFAALEIREKFSRVKPLLPREIEKPVIANYDDAQAAVLIFALTSETLTPEEIRDLVKNPLLYSKNMGKNTRAFLANGFVYTSPEMRAGKDFTGVARWGDPSEYFQLSFQQPNSAELQQQLLTRWLDMQISVYISVLQGPNDKKRNAQIHNFFSEYLNALFENEALAERMTKEIINSIKGKPVELSAGMIAKIIHREWVSGNYYLKAGTANASEPWGTEISLSEEMDKLKEEVQVWSKILRSMNTEVDNAARELEQIEALENGPGDEAGGWHQLWRIGETLHRLQSPGRGP